VYLHAYDLVGKPGDQIRSFDYRGKIGLLGSWPKVMFGIQCAAMDASPWYRRTAYRNAAKLAVPIVLDVFLLRSDTARTALNSMFGDVVLIIATVTLILLSLYAWRLGQQSKPESSTWQSGVSMLVLLLWAFAPLLFIFQSDLQAWQSAVFVQLGLGLLAFLAASLFVSQFVLPTQSTQQHSAAFRRFSGRLLGEHGPITSVRYGLAIEAQGERERTDPGVILIDHSSGAVLRTNTQFTRAVGPGLIFTQTGERIAEAIDLRLQTRSISGQSVVGTEVETNTATSSLALTEDGIPVSANLKVTFILDPGHVGPPRLGGKPDLPPYEFNPSAAEGAVIGHTYTREHDVPWTEIPIRVVTDLWREYVKGWRLEDLLGSGGQAGAVADLQFPLVQIQQQILDRLSNQKSISNGQDQRQWSSTSPEFEMLNSLGIKIVAVSITHLRVPEDVKAERLRIWRAGWAEGVQRNLRRSNQAVEQAEQQGQRDAYQRVAQAMTRSLRTTLEAGQPPGMHDTLKLILQDAAELARGEESLDEGAALAQKIERMLEALADMDTNSQGGST
jgi:regulator of protease activity HflC (stomatin/prohibitin superfamily)